MAKFAELYPDPQIFSPLARKLTWTNITEVLTLEPPVRRDFYLTLCARERWTKRTLRAQITDKLYERTIAARGSDEGVEAEVAMLRRDGTALRARLAWIASRVSSVRIRTGPRRSLTLRRRCRMNDDLVPHERIESCILLTRSAVALQSHTHYHVI
jgi:hypothetical protein